MPKTLTAGEAIAAELDLLRQEDEARAKRVHRIETLQLPIVAEVAEILKTQSLADALPELEARLASLTDSRANALANLIAHGQHTLSLMGDEHVRLTEMVRADEEAKAAADAA